MRAKSALPFRLEVRFGAPVRDGNWVYLPMISGHEDFNYCRIQLLGEEGRLPRKQIPHLTLIHPRNGVCNETIFNEIAQKVTPFGAVFDTIRFIEQRDGGPWKVYARFGDENEV